MNDVHRFVEVFRLAARQAGAVARHLQGEVGRRDKAGESSPEAAALTPADLAAQEVLLLALHDALPGAAVDAEELTESTALFPSADRRGPVMVIDPIDGTYNFSWGSADYAVMGGWLEEGSLRAAVVCFPASGELLWALAGEGAWRQRGWSTPAPLRLPAALDRVLVTPGVAFKVQDDLRSRGFAIETSRCSAVDGTAPAVEGVGSLTESPLDRRRAVALLITLVAGGTVLVGGDQWRREDPETLAVRAPVIAAPTPAMAARIAAVAGSTDREEA